MYGLPKTPEVIKAIVDVIKAEDEVKASLIGDRNNTCTGSIIGILIIKLSSKYPIYIPIEKSNDYEYRNRHIKNELTVPNAAIIKTVEGTVIVVVDDVFMNWMDTDASVWRQSMAYAILHHEAGHYIAGHLTVDPSPTPKLNTVDHEALQNADDMFPITVKALLDGDIFTIELEASMNAMRTVDDPIKVIALHSYLVATSDTLGMRMENSNMVDKLIEVLESSTWDDRDKSNDPMVEYYFSTSEEIGKILND